MLYMGNLLVSKIQRKHEDELCTKTSKGSSSGYVKLQVSCCSVPAGQKRLKGSSKHELFPPTFISFNKSRISLKMNAWTCSDFVLFNPSFHHGSTFNFSSHKSCQHANVWRLASVKSVESTWLTEGSLTHRSLVKSGRLRECLHLNSRYFVTLMMLF